MPSGYFTRETALYRTVVKHCPASLKGRNKEYFETLAAEMYHLEPLEDLRTLPSETMAAITANALEFIKERKPGKPQIRVFTPTKRPHGWEGDYTVVEILNNDMPFLVDSINEEITRQNVNIYQLFHPVISVQRDKKGKLEELKAGKQEGRVQESFIHLQISSLEAKQQKELEQAISQVLQTVAAAVIDWRPTMRILDNAINEFALNASAREARCPEKEAATFREYAAETRDFLEWLKADNFVFLGYAFYQVDGKRGGRTASCQKDSSLGVFRLADPDVISIDARSFAEASGCPLRGDNLVEITKANKRSMVHRPVHMDYIGIRVFDPEGKITGEHRFLGLFTSQVYYQSARLIPIIRKKIAHVQEKAGYVRSGHSSKALAAVLESFPRDELFQISEQDLYTIALDTVALGVRQRLRLFVRPDDFGRFLSCIVYIPRERMSTSLRGRIEKILCEAFNGTISNHYTQITEAHLARLQVVVKTPSGTVPEYDVRAIEAKLAKAARLWSDELAAELSQRFGSREGERMYQVYREAFPVSYTERFSTEDAYYDIVQLEKLKKNGAILFDIYSDVDKTTDIFHLKIYHAGGEILLSEIMPLLENMGLSVLDEHTYQVGSENNLIWVYHFRFCTKMAERPKLISFKANLEAGFTKTWEEQAENDGMNRLIIRAGLSWREAVVFRAYARYLKQAGFPYGQDFIQETLGRHAPVVAKLYQLFDIRFNPKAASQQTRQEAETKLVQSIERDMAKVSNLSEDSVLRAYMTLIHATLRTNFYQPQEDGTPKPYVSFKFRSAEIPFLPLPKPYAEIFVYSPRVEAIHLRGGKVARGGLRWSDRKEDFRTEVLGLMKAQMSKNAVIVPVGSKGGFIVKQPPQGGDREAFLHEGITCYKTFLRGLLDITDNYVDGKPKTPAQVVRHDDYDPYLVVAADKGTATFSDYANSVSEEYGFWLGDAFASGGSVGYDHKKMGITARGGWISVQRHFREMGLDTQKQDFTVAGVGDMSGDVFGNGMLLSKHIRLVAAFNHMHIFLDPNPDAAASFKERQRLFNLPKSTWKDYDEKLISKGGGIFERSAKSLTLSKEIKEVLGTTHNTMTPDELVKAILLAPVDLLWNGGIGTYVKSSLESHADAGDRTNDAVRVNGAELRARVVGEGGNLGFTQRGRIEFARRGGRINTDAIDNSAGVDCSDHEVNIKIALSHAMTQGKFSRKQRDVLLVEMTDTVANLVLRDNRLQTQSLTIAEQQGNSLLELQAGLISKLEREGRLNRKIEFLPTEEEFQRLQHEGRGLTRPELSVVLAYSKLALYDDLLASELPDDPYFSGDLALYFPEMMRSKFDASIQKHPLRREIIATFITNSIVNRVGSTFFYQMSENTGRHVCDIARAYTIVRDLFGLRELWKDIEELDGKVAAATQVEMFIEVQNFVERCSLWFLRHRQDKLEVGAIVKEFGEGVDHLREILPEVVNASPFAQRLFKRRFAHYRGKEVPDSLSRQIGLLDAFASSCNIVQVANKYKVKVEVAGHIYFTIGARLSFGWMRNSLAEIAGGSYWQRLSYKMLIHTLYDQQMRLTANILQQSAKDKSSLSEAWEEANKEALSRYDRFMEDIKTQEKMDFHLFVIASKRLEEICGIAA